MYVMHLYLTVVFALTCAASGNSPQTFVFQDICPSVRGNAVVKIGPTSAGSNSSAILRAVRDDGILKMYPMNFRCTIDIIPPPSHNIVVSVKIIDFRRSCYDNITLTDSAGNVQTYCGYYSSDEETQSKSFIGKLTVDFRTGNISQESNVDFDGFVLTLTTYESGFCFDYHQFRCDNNRCIAKDLKCDGHNHCGDRSDQRQCDVATTCESYEFSCTNGRCIRSSYVCDGDNDCGDWSDERNCDSTSYSSRTGTSVGRIIGSIFGCFFLFIAVVTGALYYRSRANRTVRVVDHPSPYSITHPPPPPSQATFPASPPMPQTQPYANPYPPLGKELQDHPPPYAEVVR